MVCILNLWEEEKKSLELQFVLFTFSLIFAARNGYFLPSVRVALSLRVVVVVVGDAVLLIIPRDVPHDLTSHHPGGSQGRHAAVDGQALHQSKSTSPVQFTAHRQGDKSQSEGV